MGIGYLLGGIFCILYFVGVGYLGGVKRNEMVLKLTKMKLNKNMSDDTAAKVDLIFGILLLVVGIALLVFGAIQG